MRDGPDGASFACGSSPAGEARGDAPAGGFPRAAPRSCASISPLIRCRDRSRRIDWICASRSLNVPDALPPAVGAPGVRSPAKGCCDVPEVVAPIFCAGSAGAGETPSCATALRVSVMRISAAAISFGKAAESAAAGRCRSSGAGPSNASTRLTRPVFFPAISTSNCRTVDWKPSTPSRPPPWPGSIEKSCCTDASPIGDRKGLPPRERRYLRVPAFATM
jgi:hypothetical protein